MPYPQTEKQVEEKIVRYSEDVWFRDTEELLHIVRLDSGRELAVRIREGLQHYDIYRIAGYANPIYILIGENLDISETAKIFAEEDEWGLCGMGSSW